MTNIFPFLIFVFSLLSLFTPLSALMCKCTKSSTSVTCIEEKCETEGYCLMLNHPGLGIHYTCHSRGLPNGKCTTKTAKSGASVEVCSCASGDFCNEELWPDDSRRQRDSGDLMNGVSKIAIGIPLAVSVAYMFFRA